MIIMEYTTIRISTWLKEKLDRLGGRGDTYEDIIIKQLDLTEEYQEHVRDLEEEKEKK